MNMNPFRSRLKAMSMAIIGSVCLALICVASTQAHPLGNFTINHYTKIEVGPEKIRLHYVIDMAEIPAFQELQRITGSGEGHPTAEQLKIYATQISLRYASGLSLMVDGTTVRIQVSTAHATVVSASGGLQTLHVESDMLGFLETNSSSTRKLKFTDDNFSERLGWRELVVVPGPGTDVFDSSAYGNGVTNELKDYPQDMLAAPLNERSMELSFSTSGVPAGARGLTMRDGRSVSAPARDRLTELIAVPTLTLGVALTSLLLAFLLGGMHALSPGHGKTVVGAYLVGSRGTARHAAFLGLTVTITHTAGVFALGAGTLLASEYVVPEKMFPVLSLLSGAIVVAIGGSLLFRRLRSVASTKAHHHGSVPHSHDVEGDHEHPHDPTQPHSHGGRTHTHLPPGADGGPITWRSLLALGISGGILPCPSALVVLLAAIALHRVGYGLLLVLAFSAGLASVLTTVGLAFVYGSRFVRSTGKFERLTRIVPVGSAVVVTCAGLAICYSALDQAGFNLADFVLTTSRAFSRLETREASLQSLGSLGMLGLGLVFGLKHATEVDHIVAVSAIVSEQRKLSRAAIVGGLWGAGHTFSLVVVGVIVLALRISIPDSVAHWLEFCVALMIIGLGITALFHRLRVNPSIHIHEHAHSIGSHSHIHFHEIDQKGSGHSHRIKRIGLKPAIVGALHGLAGSAALTLLVLSQIDSLTLGLLYLLVFGVGSIFGMLLMSGLIGIPFVLSSQRLGRFHYGLQVVAGCLSIVFGIWYAYVI